MAHIDYFYSHLSPWTYLGHQRFLAMVEKAGATVRYIPVDSKSVFAESGGLPLAKRPVQRRTYRMQEMERWRDHLGIPLVLQPKHHPGPDAPSAKLALAAQHAGADLGQFAFALMQALWAEDKNLSDPDDLKQIADGAGYDGAELLRISNTDALQEELDANTAEAIEKQVFGYPWYLIDGEAFWGQDRLDFVERKLLG